MHEKYELRENERGERDTLLHMCTVKITWKPTPRMTRCKFILLKLPSSNHSVVRAVLLESYIDEILES